MTNRTSVCCPSIPAPIARLTVAALYIGSLCFPALDCGVKQHSHMVPELADVVWGWQLLILGPFGLLELNPAWLANPVLWFGVWRLKAKPRAAGWLGVLAMTFATVGLLVLAHEGKVQRLLPGSWLWLASMAMLAVTGGLRGYERFSLRALLVSVLFCSVACAVLFRLLLPEIGSARDAARHAQCIYNLQQIAFALRSYHEEYGCFPAPYVADANGKPMHSWRAALTPYLIRYHSTADSLPTDYLAFYHNYDFGTPWNSPANLALARATFCDIYMCPGADQPGGDKLTNYVMIVGQSAAPRAGELPSHGQKGGAPSTVVVAEIADSDILWTEPRDLTLDEVSLRIDDRSTPSTSRHHLRGAVAVPADGTFQFLDEPVPLEQLRAMLSSESIQTGSGGR